MARTLQLLDSIALIKPDAAGAVVVSGSHGGVSAASFVVDLAAAVRPLAVFYNDAGLGKDGAGIAGLAMLQAIGVAAMAYSHDSARIGEAEDGLAHGVLSHCNAAALSLGVRVGQPVQEVVAQLQRL